MTESGYWLVTGEFRWLESKSTWQKEDFEGLKSNWWWGNNSSHHLGAYYMPGTFASKHLTHFASFNPHNNPMRKPRHRDTKCLAGSHTARRQHSWDFQLSYWSSLDQPGEKNQEQGKKWKERKIFPPTPTSPRTEEKQRKRGHRLPRNWETEGTEAHLRSWSSGKEGHL